jgi:hypothetical protein
MKQAHLFAIVTGFSLCSSGIMVGIILHYIMYMNESFCMGSVIPFEFSDNTTLFVVCNSVKL